MTKEWGQRNKTPILRLGWGLGPNHQSFWQKDGVRKILQPPDRKFFCPHFSAKLSWVFSAFLPCLPFGSAQGLSLSNGCGGKGLGRLN